jgi:hypothetical protein
MTDPAPPKASRRTLYLLLALFFLPLAASFVLYYGVEWRPSAGANHGELLQPLRQLPEPLAKTFEGKWAMLYVGDGACDAACREALVVARQTHLLLNRDATRMRRAILATSGCCDRDFLEREHAGIEILDAADPALRGQLLDSLPPGEHAHDLFVVDPLSNVVLRFDTRENPKGLLEDLKKLLKLSHIG